MRYLVIFFMIILFSCQRGEVGNYEVYLNHNDTVKYVGKEQCRMCHVEIYESYMETGMGKSLHYAIKEHSVLESSNLLIIHDSIKNLSYQPFFKNDSLYLKEFRLKGDDTTHLLIRKVDYKIGSGHHTNSHLFEINGYVHQMPYTYYTQDAIADFPPGFEDGDNTRFSRKIGLECMSCHNAYPHHNTGSINKYKAIPQGIDCERCHGPGEIHVNEKLLGNIVDTSKHIDYTIVNPSRLPSNLEFDVCQRCHLQGTAILAQGKTFFDFKPGMELTDVMDIYMPKYEGNESFIMASHVERLKQSACFDGSDITCVTCHNPHKSVSTVSSTYFDNKCMQCHNICKDEETQNCSSCHMPNSSSTDIMHVSITDHKIGVHNNKKNQQGEFLGLVAINNPKSSNLSRAKAYLKRYESFESESIYLDSAWYYLSISSHNFTSYIQYYYLSKDIDGLIKFVMGNDLDDSKYSKSELALAYSRIGHFLSSNNFPDEASKYYQQSVSLMPFVIEYKIKYGSFLFNYHRIAEAKQQYLDALCLNPTVKEVHANLGLIAIMDGDYLEAESSLKQAVALDPDYILAYENLVLLSQKRNDNHFTRLYLQKIIDIDPKHKAKEILDNLQ